MILFLCAYNTPLHHRFMKIKCFYNLQEKKCPGVTVERLLLEAGFLLISGEEQKVQGGICMKHISLWQMLLYAYCLLYCDNIMAVSYG